jgi:hypothetical protein
MPSKKTTAEFIKEAKAIHGDRYDYSKVVYVTHHFHVQIICSEHGEFWQRPHSHRRGLGCQRCGQKNKKGSKKHYCKFCETQIYWPDAGKKRCKSADCVAQHNFTTGRKTGCLWKDAICHKWKQEKKRQRSSSLTGWDRKCTTTWITLWSKEGWKKERKAKHKTAKTWKWTVATAWHNSRKAAEESEWSEWKKKVVRFCREATQGRRNMANRMGKIKRQDLLDCLKQQNYRCALSGWELTPDTAQIDHKDPVSKGGKTEISNLQWLHEKINRMKGAMTMDEFLKVCRLIASSNPPTPY